MSPLELVLQMACQFGNRRKVENLGEIDLVRVDAVDLLVDFNQFQGARAELKEIVVDADPLAFEGRIADLLQRLLDLGARARGRSALCLTQLRELRKFAVKFPLSVAFLEQMTLDLAARRLGDALYRHHLRDLKTGVLVDEPRNLCGEG